MAEGPLNREGRVAVIGTGNMGSRYVLRLLAAGFAVTVWNRSGAKLDPLIAAGAAAASGPAAAIESASLLLCALEHAAAMEATVLAPAGLAALRADHLVIDTSTVLPAAARGAARRLAERGAHYVDAPVSGGTRGADAGTLTLLLGGTAEAVDRARPVLAPLGRVHHLGAVGAGQTAKLVNQVIVAGTIAAVAEALALAERAGLDPAAVVTALQGGFADSRVLREHGVRMATRNFVAGASNRVFLKDLDAIQSLAADQGIALPIAEQIASAYRELVDTGFAEEDHAALWRLVMPGGRGA